jgi:CheY-like chemotaxis protein
MTRAAALRSQGGPKKPAPDLPPPSATLPPTPAMLLGTRPPEAPGPGPATAPGPEALRRGGAKATLELVLEEIRAVRETQQRILDALGDLRRRSPAAAAAAGVPAPAFDDALASPLSPIRAARRRSVLLVDDDPATRADAVAELERADVPVRAFDDGNAALAAIAEDKPDLIALEIGLGGDMGGKDVVNMIKATMEWVDIPIVLWTREPIANQREAQQVHGADEIVPKSGGAKALVARVITVFRRS